MGERRRLREKLPIVRERAVFAFAVSAPVVRGVLEERDEVRDPDDVDPGGPQLGLERQPGEHHVAAVGAAPQRRAVGSKPALSRRPWTAARSRTESRRLVVSSSDAYRLP